MKEYPKISIITPSFNQAQYLEQTILSVINQGYPNLEYFVIDGSSTDGSVDIIKKYEKQITHWVSEKDRGQSHAINKGIQKSSGDIINWLNSDDYYEPSALFKVAEQFADPEINVVSGRGRLFSKDKTVGYTKGVDVYEGNLAKTIGWVRMDQPETFFRRRVIDVIGPLDERLHYLMDRDWWLKYLLAFGLAGIKKIPDVLVDFRLHENSKTNSSKERFNTDHHSFFYALARNNGYSQFAKVISAAGDIHPDFYLDLKTNVDKKLIEKAFSYYFLLRANICYEQYNREKAFIFYNLVNTGDLKDDDRRLFRTMRFRNKIPVSLIKLIRQFTRKFSIHEN